LPPPFRRVKVSAAGTKCGTANLAQRIDRNQDLPGPGSIPEAGSNVGFRVDSKPGKALKRLTPIGPVPFQFFARFCDGLQQILLRRPRSPAS
jgi:hypothetical protein